MTKTTKRVLLAEPDIETAKVIGKALKEKGMEVLYAKEGSKALRQAVEGTPDLIITEINLPLLNAVKIAQILKSNPKTKEVPIIFLSAGDLNPAYLPYFQDSIVKKPFNLEEVMTRVDRAFLRAEKFVEVQEEEKEIEGNLQQMSLVDILQIFSMNKKNGALVVRNEERAEEGMIFLGDGEVMDATAGMAKGEKALYRLLTWEEGKFEYIPKSFLTEKSIAKPTDALLMEGMRQIDEWKRMSAEFPSMETEIYLIEDPSRMSGELRPATKDVISLLGYYKVVRDIVNNSQYSDYDVMMTIHTLMSKGVIALSTEEIRKEKAPPLLTGEEAFAIKERLKTPMKESYDMDIVKVPVFCNNSKYVKRLTEIFSEIEGFKVDRSFFEAADEGVFLGEIGRIKASDSITLLLQAFPLDMDGSSLWPALMGDSIGAIILREGDDELTKDIIDTMKVSMKLDTGIVNVDKSASLLEDKNLFQINMWDIGDGSASKAIHSLLDSFLNI